MPIAFPPHFTLLRESYRSGSSPSDALWAKILRITGSDREHLSHRHTRSLPVAIRLVSHCQCVERHHILTLRGKLLRERERCGWLPSASR